MKYYVVRHTDNIPAWAAATSRLFLISIRKGKEGDVGILEHEKTHVRQWWKFFIPLSLVGWLLLYFASGTTAGFSASLVVIGLAPSLHALLYKTTRRYRLWSEVEAYRAQIRHGGRTQAAVKGIMNPEYRFNLTEQDAKELLGVTV